MRAYLVLGSLLFLGCGDHDHPPTAEVDKSPQPLVALEDWVTAAREQDPFVTPDSPPECEQSGVRAEEAQRWLELDTNECDFITVIAGARYDVAEGDELQLDVSHFDLDAAAPSKAEVRLWFAECPVWEKSIAIPSAAQVYSERFASPCPIAQGGQVLLHVSNHGQNTYQFRSLTVLR
jgi:hypothetical protein